MRPSPAGIPERKPEPDLSWNDAVVPRANRMRASDTATLEAEQPRVGSERGFQRCPPGTLRSRERPSRDAHTSSTWPCRNSGSNRPRPHRNGRHTSWHSPLTNRAALYRELRRQNPQTPADFVGTVLLFWRGRIRIVGAARLLVGRILRSGLLPGAGILFVFAQACLNLIDDAQIADEFDALCIDALCLAVRLVKNRGRTKVRQLGLAERETRSRKNDDQRR